MAKKKPNNKKKTSAKKTTKTTTTTTTTVTTTTEVDKNLDTHYLLVLDRSGSMSSCWDATIEGLNEQLGTIRGLEKKYKEQRYFVSLVVFDSEVETILEDVPVSEVEDFEGNEFPPRGLTALHDAMGIGISNLKANLKKKDKDSNSISTALVVIMTDGGENASRENNAISIKEMIDELEGTKAWTFSFMGANQDSVLTARNLGIRAGNTVNYSSTATGANVASKTLSRAFAARGASSNIAYMNTSSYCGGSNVTLDAMDLETDTFLSDVVEGNTIGEDESKSKGKKDKKDKV